MAKVLIVGATGGIGRAIAEQLVETGHSVHLAGRNAETLEALGTQLGAPTTLVDVLDSASLQSLAQASDTLDGVVYAVGSITLKPLQRLTTEDALRDYQLNALGAALTVQALLPALKRGVSPASVVLFSSVAASQGFAFHASIAMAKAAVEGLTRSLAAELAPRVRVNCIAPSLTRTPLSQSLLSRDGSEAMLGGLHALPRIGEPSDMAALARFLLSPEASWITGQVIGVDGGRATLRPKG